MNILVLGATGMLGHKLMQTALTAHRVTGTVRGSADAFLEHPVLGGMRLTGGIDAERIDTVRRVVEDTLPDAVVNCVGVIKQAGAAKDPVTAIGINALFPHLAAEVCRDAGARLIHVSTDCVFSGASGCYREDDVPDASDLYGRSKLLGEVAGAGALTLRTSIVGRELHTCSGLFEWFFRQRGGAVNGFDRAIFSGLTTSALAGLIVHLIESAPQLQGLWHVSAEPISKYRLLGMLNDALDLRVQIGRDTDFSCDRSLDSTRFRAALHWAPPSWDQMIHELTCDPTPYDRLRRTC